MMWLRHAFAIVVLPFTMTVIIPVFISWRNGFAAPSGSNVGALLTQLSGLVVLLLGFILFVASLAHFDRDGRGTLAPWDPPKHLVVHGPYRFVRNPMISGVLFILIGEALVLLSRPHLTWALVFFVINAIYIPLVEEPRLASRFQTSYDVYRRHVPRLIPRLRPWDPRTNAEQGSA